MTSARAAAKETSFLVTFSQTFVLRTLEVEKPQLYYLPVLTRELSFIFFEGQNLDVV